MHLPRYKYFLAIIDFITISSSFFEARYFLIIYKEKPLVFNYPNIFGISYSFITVTLLFTIIFLLIFQYNNLYKINILFIRSIHLATIIKSIFNGTILLITTSFFFKFSYLIESRSLVISIAITLVLNLFLIRIILIRYLLNNDSRNRFIVRNVAIVGAGDSGKLLAAKISFEEIHGLKLIGFIDDKHPTGTNIMAGIQNLGDTEELSFIKERYNIEEFIISIDNISYPNLLALIDKCSSIGAIVKLNSQLFNIIPQKIETEFYSNIPVIEVSTRMNNKFYFLAKSIVDFIFSAICLILLSPIFIIIALVIKLSSKGPVFYKDTRIGKNGKPFIFYKFRSMEFSNNEDTERKAKMIEFMKNHTASNNGHTKIINAKRVTWIGKFLRKTSFDEFPQLINVIKGEMSIVGPRPCLPYEYDQYDEWHKRRVSVMPGCTGVWQVSGRSNVSFNDSVILDLFYIKNMSPWLDLQLIIKTIPVMVCGKGGK